MGEISGIPVAALLPLFILLAAFAIYCWWDIWHQESVNYLPKWAWAILCVVSIPLGGIVYFLIGRKG
ncbi:MAG: PLDc N-terminal domain-containing protein [Thermomicrobiales bacterium]